MTLPLFTLFCVNSFFKQMLPHWILPCLWPMVLILRKRSLKDIAFLKETFFVLYLVILGAIFSLNIEPVSSYLASHSTEMKEWFLWEKVSAALQAKDYFKAEKIEKEHCPKNPVAIAFNWFRAAQLSVHLPQNVSVYCLDFFKPNFYYFRDMNRFDSLNGCFVTIFGYKDDFINMEPYFKETNSYPFDEVPSINDPLWVKQGMLNGLDSNKSFKF